MVRRLDVVLTGTDPPFCVEWSEGEVDKAK